MPNLTKLHVASGRCLLCVGVWILLGALLPRDVSASPSSRPTIRLDRTNKTRVIRLRELDKFGVRAACFALKPERYAAGTIIGRNFIQGLSSLTPKQGTSRRDLRSAFRSVTKRCYALSQDAVNWTPPPLPDLTIWENNMRIYGRRHCLDLLDGSRSFDERLADTYYDAQWTYYRIGDYLTDRSWDECARTAGAIYRDGYVLPNDGTVPGYWNFGRGLVESVLRENDPQSRRAAILLANNGLFARSDTPESATTGAEASREVAYSILAHLNLEALGRPRSPRLSLLVDNALGHIDQWFVHRSTPYKSFMVGLTAQALITYRERTADPRVLPALRTALDALWSEGWSAPAAAFAYRSVGEGPEGRDPAPDLNLLIAPAYAWLWYRTGQPLYAARADAVFEGGVFEAYLANAKQFNQNYRWSFDYVTWRRSKATPFLP